MHSSAIQWPQVAPKDSPRAGNICLIEPCSYSHYLTTKPSCADPANSLQHGGPSSAVMF
jgi:hypothetical protein